MKSVPSPFPARAGQVRGGRLGRYFGHAV